MDKLFHYRLKSSTSKRLIRSAVFIYLLVGMVVVVCPAAGQTSDEQKLGKIKIEGKSVRELVLQRKDGITKTFKKPGEVIELPIGEYHIYYVYLEGKYQSYAYRDSEVEWVKAEPNEPGILKVGGPLKQGVKVRRRGRNLLLDYELWGRGDEKYQNLDISKPPQFAVYQGDKKIGSGTFEYG
ncbi:MAG: hypothetical protein AMJ79_11130 [Phycisphaerae bacterium SM23_30]|nr:MAG: hypothetical protein AMJ79_11130 [Phycisphaerae bacterium SM23_30]